MNSHIVERTQPGVTAPRTRSSAQLKRSLAQSGPLVALIAAVVLFSAINPQSFATFRNLLTVLDLAAIPLILCVGLTFVILMGQMDLSIEGVMGAAGLSFVLLSSNSVNSNNFPVLNFILPLALAVALGVISALIHVSVGVPTFMTSLGIWYVGLGIATILFGGSQPQLREPGLTNWISDSPLLVTNAVVVAIVFIGVGLWLQHYSKFGRATYAIGEDESVARLLSVNVRRTKLIAFGVAGFCAGVAGILASMRIGVGVVAVGSGQLFFTVAAVVVGGTILAGGRGGIGRSVVGVLLLTVIGNGLVLSGVSSNIQVGISGAIIVLAVVFTDFRKRRPLRVVK